MRDNPNNAVSSPLLIALSETTAVRRQVPVTAVAGAQVAITRDSDHHA